MALCFLDSSALVKRYIQETGSAWTRTLTNPASGHRLYVARITGPEMVAAITRRQRRGETTPADAAAALAAFRADFAAALFALDITATVIARAMDLAEQHGLRGYDAVQLAAAWQLRALCRAAGTPDPLLMAADGDLNRAAIADGFPVDNPNQHP